MAFAGRPAWTDECPLLWFVPVGFPELLVRIIESGVNGSARRKRV
jgi:hypothetical protein